MALTPHLTSHRSSNGHRTTYVYTVVICHDGTALLCACYWVSSKTDQYMDPPSLWLEQEPANMRERGLHHHGDGIQ